MENGGTDDVVPLLWDIAEEAFSSNQILAGLRCLEAIVQGKAKAQKSSHPVSVLPMQEALTRLRIAEILLEHTYNIEEAKDHLERTIMLLHNTRNAGEYWLKAHAHLASIHEQAKNTSIAKTVLKQALDGASESPEWRYYFLLRLADVHVHENNINEARAFLESGVKNAEANGSKIYLNIFYLALFQTSILRWDLPTSSDIKRYLDSVIPNTASSLPEAGNMPVPMQQQQYYYFLLSALQNLRVGDMENLPTILSSLKEAHRNFHSKTINIPNTNTNNNNITNTTTNNTPNTNSDNNNISNNNNNNHSNNNDSLNTSLNINTNDSNTTDNISSPSTTHIISALNLPSPIRLFSTNLSTNNTSFPPTNSDTILPLNNENNNTFTINQNNTSPNFTNSNDTPNSINTSNNYNNTNNSAPNNTNIPNNNNSTLNNNNISSNNFSTINNNIRSIPFSYLDSEAVMTVLLNLILAISSRANNTIQSIASVEAGLNSADVAMQSGKLTVRQFCSVLRLKFYLHENLFYIKLTQNDMNAALLQIKICHQIYVNHKYTDDLIGGVGGFESIIHSMCCLMAHACGSFDLAISHARLAMQKAKQDYVQFVCMLYMLLLYLQTGAIDTVERLISQYSQRWQTHPQKTLRVLSTFVEGIVLHMRGTDDAARKKFSASLSLGREIKNNQATAQILNEIAKMFLKNTQDRAYSQNGQPDPTAADLAKRTQDTAESAYKLAHHMGDIGAQLVSLKVLQALYQMTNNTSPQAQQYMAALTKKEAIHKSRLLEVVNAQDFLLIRHLAQ